jgi:hypothetical protein
MAPVSFAFQPICSHLSPCPIHLVSGRMYKYHRAALPTTEQPWSSTKPPGAQLKLRAQAVILLRWHTPRPLALYGKTEIAIIKLLVAKLDIIALSSSPTFQSFVRVNPPFPTQF